MGRITVRGDLNTVVTVLQSHYGDRVLTKGRKIWVRESSWVQAALKTKERGDHIQVWTYWDLTWPSWILFLFTLVVFFPALAVLLFTVELPTRRLQKQVLAIVEKGDYVVRSIMPDNPYHQAAPPLLSR